MKSELPQGTPARKPQRKPQREPQREPQTDKERVEPPELTLDELEPRIAPRSIGTFF